MKQLLLLAVSQVVFGASDEQSKFRTPGTEINHLWPLTTLIAVLIRRRLYQRRI